MPGQGFHIGVNKRLIDSIDQDLFLSRRFVAGTLVPDTLAQQYKGLVTRRNSHYCGGAGLVYPNFEKIKDWSEGDLKVYDYHTKNSYITDPEIVIDEFFDNNKHLSNDDPYKVGILMHLLADYKYDDIVANKVFDLSHQDQGKIYYKGEELDEKEFRTSLYAFYPALDQYVLDKLGVTKENITTIRDICTDVFPDKSLAFLERFVNYNKDMVFNDSRFYTKEQVDGLLQSIERDYPEMSKQLIKR